MMPINIEDMRPVIRHLLPVFADAQRQVDAAPDKVTRDGLIDTLRARLQDQWMEVRAAMSMISNNTCWYTECENPGAGDDIDHFRPKKSVREDKPHGGYYWLAFEPWNFRLSCQRANRVNWNPETDDTGGKSDHFPLVPNTPRAADSSADINQEQYLLLDPTKPRHPDVLTFLPSGHVAIHPDFEGNTLDEMRFEKSREYYHLDWPNFKAGRTSLYNVIEREVERGKRCAPPEGTSSIIYTPEFDSVVEGLRRSMERSQPYSAAAKAYLMGFRDVWWVERHVLGLPKPRPAQEGGAASGVASNQTSS